MERNVVKVLYDPEENFLEVIFDRREGYFRETVNDQVMEKDDAEGNVLGCSVLAVSSLKHNHSPPDGTQNGRGVVLCAVGG